LDENLTLQDYNFDERLGSVLLTLVEKDENSQNPQNEEFLSKKTKKRAPVPKFARNLSGHGPNLTLSGYSCKPSI